MGPWEAFWIFFYSLATWGNAGFLREQVCIYMCPYARFQSAMFDKNTLIISYDEQRGDPRGSRRKNEDPKIKGLGDCIDCTLCVQVCPTGIDIRNGLQYQCIACAACVDVCNEVMDKMGYERNLVHYTTENATHEKKTSILRPRVIIYAAILVLMSATLVYSMATRVPLQLDVIRDRISLYRETDEGLIENVYLIKIINMDAVAHEFTLRASGITDLKLDYANRMIKVAPGEVIELPVKLSADPTDLVKRSNHVQFHLSAKGNEKLNAEEDARFLGPAGVRR